MDTDLHVIDRHALKQFALRSDNRKHLNFITKVMKCGTVLDRKSNEEHCENGFSPSLLCPINMHLGVQWGSAMGACVEM